MEKLQQTGVLYYLREREDVHDDMFEPVSKSQWRLLREMCPGKISKSYGAYVEDCNDRYLNELESRKEVALELTSVMWDLEDLARTQLKINGIQEEEGFTRWATGSKDIVDDILKIKE